MTRSLADSPPILVIAGPTAAGKSGLAFALAERFNGELISADSAQVYRGLDIGTAKPTRDELEQVPHHLVNIVEIEDEYDAGRFVADADAVIKTIRSRGKLPIVVGGTGMYIRALMYGMIEAPGADPVVRAKIEAQIADEGAAQLHVELLAIDPEAGARIHPNDTVRIIRALEVFRVTGRTLSAHHKEHDITSRAPRYEARLVVISPPRETLYARINARVDVMLEEGWLDEVKNLIERGVDPNCRPMQIMGYRHLVAWVVENSELPWPSVVELIKRDHRRYAKRQLTWLRSQPAFEWFESADLALQALEPMLQQ